ncbi:MAG: hypothetical protein LBV70_05930, partial [Candidatus Adiutrix sp.]|nr:hypothetical protein [Candidatus Adiutrix sp.]
MKKILFCLLFLISTSLLLLPGWLDRKFADPGFEQIVFTLRSGLDGVDMYFVYSFVRNVVLTPLAILIVLLIAFRLVSQRVNTRGLLPRYLPASLMAIYLFVAVVTITVKYDLIGELT